MFETKYRVSRDSMFSRYWAVQIKRWWLPIWVEFGNGLLLTRADAEELIECLTDVRTRSTTLHKE